MMHLQSSASPTPAILVPPVTTVSNPTSVFFRPYPQRWGDLPSTEDDPGIAALERETVTKPRPMTVEPMKLFQPMSAREEIVGLKQERKVSGLFGPAKQEGTADRQTHLSSLRDFVSATPARLDIVIDPRIIHSIQLSQYVRKMNALLAEMLESSGKKKMVPAAAELPKPPSLPATPASLTSQVTWKQEMRFLPFDSPPDEESLSPFVSGHWSSSSPSPMPISPSTCRHLLKKSVFVLLAHAGFDNAAESATEFLTDLLHSYLTQLTENLADARDAESSTGHRDFPDILERVFLEMGIGSAKSLTHSYAEDVVKPHEYLQRQSDSLTTRYQTLTSSPVTATNVVEKSDDEKHPQPRKIEGESKSWFTANANQAATGARRDSSLQGGNFIKPDPDVKDTKCEIVTSITGTSSNKNFSTHDVIGAPGLTTTDTTDYDADDDDVITEPSSVKSIFDNESTNLSSGVVSGGCVVGDNAVGDSANYDLVASTLINIASPNSNKTPKKKKKYK